MEIKVLKYKKIQNNNIKGFADILVETEGIPFTINGMKIVSTQNGGYFYAFPNKSISSPEGDKYYPIIAIFNKEAHARFRTLMDAAFKEYFSNPPPEQPPKTSNTYFNSSDQDDCPF